MKGWFVAARGGSRAFKTGQSTFVVVAGGEEGGGERVLEGALWPSILRDFIVVV